MEHSQTMGLSFASSARKSRGVLCVALAIAVACSPLSWAKKHKAPAAAVDGTYTTALGVANRFLAAWQGNDQEAGLLLLTDRAKHKSSEAGIDSLFSGSSQRAYEIVRGRPLGSRRYEFPVVLLQTAVESKQVHRKFTKIVVANAGQNDWAVDTLP